MKKYGKGLRAHVGSSSGNAVDAVISAETSKRENEDSAQTGSTDLVPLNFRVSAQFRRDFKVFAATHDLKLSQLLKLSFEFYRKKAT